MSSLTILLRCRGAASLPYFVPCLWLWHGGAVPFLLVVCLSLICLGLVSDLPGACSAVILPSFRRLLIVVFQEPTVLSCWLPGFCSFQRRQVPCFHCFRVSSLVNVVSVGTRCADFLVVWSSFSASGRRRAFIIFLRPSFLSVLSGSPPRC